MSHTHRSIHELSVSIFVPLIYVSVYQNLTEFFAKALQYILINGKESTLSALLCHILLSYLGSWTYIILLHTFDNMSIEFWKISKWKFSLHSIRRLLTSYYVISLVKMMYAFIYLGRILFPRALHFSSHQVFKIHNEIFAQNFHLLFWQQCSGEFLQLVILFLPLLSNEILSFWFWLLLIW